MKLPPARLRQIRGTAGLVETLRGTPAREDTFEKYGRAYHRRYARRAVNKVHLYRLASRKRVSITTRKPIPHLHPADRLNREIHAFLKATKPAE